jgi:nucleotide-binding universal stress UspA family protein
MFKTVLIPIDLSHAEVGKAMIGAAKRIGGEGVQIILINVVEDIPTYVAAELPGGYLEKSTQSAQEALEEIANEANIQASVEVRSGQVYRSILAAAEERNVDLIVIGSHRPGFQDFLLGSTAARVVRHATCTVLVVR